MNIEGDFATDSYAIVRGAVDFDRIEALRRHVLERVDAGTFYSDSQVPAASAIYADPETEYLLGEFVPYVGEATGLDVDPTYSYLRVYRQGDRLARHRERASCEISLSLNVASIGPAPWPLFLENAKRSVGIGLAPGDGLLYRGSDCPHWRDAFTGTLAIELFLHYVDRNGPYRDHRYDRRRRLGLVPPGRVYPRHGVRSLVLGQLALHLIGPEGQTQALEEHDALIWRDIEASRPGPTIVEHVQERFRIPRSTAQLIVLRFLQDAEERSLIAL